MLLDTDSRDGDSLTKSTNSWADLGGTMMSAAVEKERGLVNIAAEAAAAAVKAKEAWAEMAVNADGPAEMAAAAEESTLPD